MKAFDAIRKEKVAIFRVPKVICKVEGAPREGAFKQWDVAQYRPVPYFQTRSSKLLAKNSTQEVDSSASIPVRRVQTWRGTRTA
jgi:hypothetical protein